MHNLVCAKLPLKLELIAPLLLSTCMTASFECPIPKDYSPAVQERAADELEALPVGSTLETFIGDYGVLRAEARACAET